MPVTTSVDLREAAPLRIARVLDVAGDILDHVGLHQGALWDRAQENQGFPRAATRQCAMAVIATAVCGDPSSHTLRHRGSLELWDAAVKAVEDSASCDIGPGRLSAWSDAPGRTAAEVTAAFREAALALRRDGTK